MAIQIGTVVLFETMGIENGYTKMVSRVGIVTGGPYKEEDKTVFFVNSIYPPGTLGDVDVKRLAPVASSLKTFRFKKSAEEIILALLKEIDGLKKQIKFCQEASAAL